MFAKYVREQGAYWSNTRAACFQEAPHPHRNDPALGSGTRRRLGLQKGTSINLLRGQISRLRCSPYTGYVSRVCQTRQLELRPLARFREVPKKQTPIKTGVFRQNCPKTPVDIRVWCINYFASVGAFTCVNVGAATNGFTPSVLYNSDGK